MLEIQNKLLNEKSSQSINSSLLRIKQCDFLELQKISVTFFDRKFSSQLKNNYCTVNEIKIFTTADKHNIMRLWIKFVRVINEMEVECFEGRKIQKNGPYMKNCDE